jgi:hypothetical protein
VSAVEVERGGESVADGLDSSGVVVDMELDEAADVGVATDMEYGTVEPLVRIHA